MLPYPHLTPHTSHRLFTSQAGSFVGSERILRELAEKSATRKRAGFVADKYARQLEELMRSLRSTHSHFVRCIKPNLKKVPVEFDEALVRLQLNCSGIFEAVREAV